MSQPPFEVMVRDLWDVLKPEHKSAPWGTKNPWPALKAEHKSQPWGTKPTTHPQPKEREG